MRGNPGAHATTAHDNDKHATAPGAIRGPVPTLACAHALSADPYLARGVFHHIWHGFAEIELAEHLLVRHAEHDEVGLRFGGLFHDGGADVAGLQDLGLDLLVPLIGATFGGVNDGGRLRPI